jgi:hypothetical protein
MGKINASLWVYYQSTMEVSEEELEWMLEQHLLEN